MLNPWTHESTVYTINMDRYIYILQGDKKQDRNKEFGAGSAGLTC